MTISLLAVAEHPRLRHANFRRFGGRKQNVVVRGVFGVGKFIRRQMAAQMVAAAGGDVQRAEDFFVLNVAARRRQFLGAKSQFAEFAGDGIGLEFAVVLVDDALAALAARSLFARARPPRPSSRWCRPRSATETRPPRRWAQNKLRPRADWPRRAFRRGRGRGFSAPPGAPHCKVSRCVCPRTSKSISK